MAEQTPAPPVEEQVALGPLTLRTPVIVASGTFGYGREYEGLLDLSRVGAVATKGITLEARPGNPPPRICETPSGMLNAIGLENPGVEAFVAEKLPWLVERGVPVIANISGSTVADYAALGGRLTGCKGVAALEVNISCPNVEHGGMEFGREPDATRAVIHAVREATSLPVIAKLSPNVTSIVDIARAAVSGGADVLSLINTLLGMAIDIERRRPRIGRGTAGLSGPAIRPVAVRMVWEVHQALPEVPLIGMGGIMTGADAVEFLLAGASAVAVGTASFVNPNAANTVLDGILHYARRAGVARVGDLVGALLG
jgi:dihydroorotate dehydrogenase (NAD+) catalytic subunit